MPFWLPNGTTLLRLIEDRGPRPAAQARLRGDQARPRSSTSSSGTAPATGTTTARTCTSRESDERDCALRPMNCPGACLVFGAERHSYRELPLRLAEFGQRLAATSARASCTACCACAPSPRTTPTSTAPRADRRRGRPTSARRSTSSTRASASRTCGSSSRPGRRSRSAPTSSGSKAEAALTEALERQGREYELNPGDGAFYGPKIDFHVTDALGRSWQCGTCQLDFQMPERFDLTYTGADDAQHRPVMIHRALLGSMERFAGILIEHYAGRFPVWLAPVQAIVLPVADRHNDYAERGRSPSCARPACGSRSTTARSRSARRSATPSSAATPTCWSSATASRRPARSPSAPTSEGELGAMPVAEFAARVRAESESG